MLTKRSLAVILPLVLLLGLFAPLSAHAQDDALTLDSLIIAVWPEFDQSAALVFYTGEVAPGTETPVELSFTLPDAASLNAVAYLHQSGNLVNAQFSIDGGTLTMQSPNGTFHIEYYDESLEFDGVNRLYSLVWLSDYRVSNLTWEVQQPAGANIPIISPGDATLSRDRFGLNLYRVPVGEVPAGQPATLTVSYEKPTRALTVEQLQDDGTAPQQPVTEPVGNTPAIGRTNLIFMIVIGVMMLALAGIAGYFYSRSTMRADDESDQDSGAGEESPAEQGAPDVPPVDSVLTDREKEVLVLLAEGLVNREIGDRLGISPRTVARHRENMMNKLEVHSRTELVMYAVRIGLVDLHED